MEHAQGLLADWVRHAEIDIMAALEQFQPSRRRLLEILKVDGYSTIAHLSGKLSVSGEAVRQHLLHLQESGHVTSQMDGASRRRAGRPAMLFRLTVRGDNLFKKDYAALAETILQAAEEALDEDCMGRLLRQLTKYRIEAFRSAVEAQNANGKLKALRDFYSPDDSFMRIVQENGKSCLVQHNCPYLNVALNRTAICSVSVSALSRLLKCRVTREKRFQWGDGCCMFKPHPDQPLNGNEPVYEPEPVVNRAQ